MKTVLSHPNHSRARVAGAEPPGPWRRSGLSGSGFTLIELLVVIAVIGILAAMILTLGGPMAEAKARKTARVYLHQLSTAIESYKGKKGFYPPDDPYNNASSLYYTNSLYYELTGTDLDKATALEAFGVGGILNSRAIAGEAIDFIALSNDRTVQTIRLGSGRQVQVLGVPLKSPLGGAFEVFAPWEYRLSTSTNGPPLHNPNTYDLWVRLQVGNKVITVGNWKE